MLIIVTGASSGLGLALSRHFLDTYADSKVVGCDLKQSSEFKQLCSKYPRRTKFVECNVTKTDQFRAVFNVALDSFPQESLKVLVNNAGISSRVLPVQFQRDPSTFTPASLIEDSGKVIGVNLQAVVTGTYLALEHFKVKKNSSNPKPVENVVINIASMAGLIPLSHDPVYTASKFGVVGFSQSANLFAKMFGIRVHAVCPFFFDTPLVRGIIQAAASNGHTKLTGNDDFQQQMKDSPLAKMPTVPIESVISAVDMAMRGASNEDSNPLKPGQVIACTPFGNKLVPPMQKLLAKSSL